MTNCKKNDIIKNLCKEVDKYTLLFTADSNSDLYRISDVTKMSFAENYLYDIICCNKFLQLSDEGDKGIWDDKFDKEIDEAYNLLSENWPILQADSMYIGYFPEIKKTFKRIYEDHPRLCTDLFPVIFFVIVENIQKIKKKPADEIYEYITDHLKGTYVNDYIYSLLDIDVERKASEGDKQRKRFQKIFHESEDIKYIYDSDEGLHFASLDWNDNTIDKDALFVNKVKSEYLRGNRKPANKMNNSEKMYALFQFLSKLWEGRGLEHFNYNKALTLYVINVMTSWINVLLLHLCKANYIFLKYNMMLYSLSNYFIKEKNELKTRIQQTQFFNSICELPIVNPDALKMYSNGTEEDKLDINRRMNLVAENIFKFVKEYLKNPDHLLIDQVIGYVLFIYLEEDEDREPSFSSLDEKLEKYFAKAQADEYLDDEEFPC